MLRHSFGPPSLAYPAHEMKASVKCAWESCYAIQWEAKPVVRESAKVQLILAQILVGFTTVVV